MVAHLALRHLISQSPHPENTTNDLVHSVLQSEPELYAKMMGHLGNIGRIELSGGVIQREYHLPTVGDQADARFDFAIHNSRGLAAVIETKVAAGLTSDDQLTRYVAHLPEQGVAIIVTRQRQLNGMVAEARRQLPGVEFSTIGQGYEGEVDGKRIVLISWTRFLAVGDGADDLTAIAEAVESGVEAPPFLAAELRPEMGDIFGRVQNLEEAFFGALKAAVKNGQMGPNVTDVNLKATFSQEGSMKRGGKLKVRGYEIWFGLDAGGWSDTDAHVSTPFWAGYVWGKNVPSPTILASFGIPTTIPLVVPIAVSQQVAVESLVQQLKTWLTDIDRLAPPYDSVKPAT